MDWPAVWKTVLEKIFKKKTVKDGLVGLFEDFRYELICTLCQRMRLFPAQPPPNRLQICVRSCEIYPNTDTCKRRWTISQSEGALP